MKPPATDLDIPCVNSNQEAFFIKAGRVADHADAPAFDISIKTFSSSPKKHLKILMKPECARAIKQVSSVGQKPFIDTVFTMWILCNESNFYAYIKNNIETMQQPKFLKFRR